jgi:hypothetical protein
MNIKELKQKNIEKINSVLSNIDYKKFILSENMFFYNQDEKKELLTLNTFKYLKDFSFNEEEIDFEELNTIIDFLIYEVNVTVSKTPSFLYQGRPYILKKEIIDINNKEDIIESEKILNKNGLITCCSYFRILKNFNERNSIVLNKTNIPIDRKELAKLRMKND